MASTTTSTIDTELVTAATQALANVAPNDGDHTVAAAARSHTGHIFTGVNVFHFTGGPCAELVVLGTAAASGVLAGDLATMVAVRKNPAAGVTHVLNPCGRCRQVLLDYNPRMRVIVLDHQGKVNVASVRDLLPFAYVYGQGSAGGVEEQEVALA